MTFLTSELRTIIRAALAVLLANAIFITLIAFAAAVA